MNEAVVVSGASTGIGLATAQLLAQRGYVVFAGIRSDADAARLEALHSNITAVALDITNLEQIEAAARTVRERAVPLRGLVNNAGIAVAGPLEFLPLERLRTQLEVNVIAQLALTQAMLPLLRETSGRVVFIGSISGRLPLPFVAPYAASKFALRALAGGLRMELRSAGIAVSLIEPGGVRTPIWKKGRDAREEMAGQLPPQAVALYGRAIEAMVEQTRNEEKNGMDAEVVAGVILRALTARKPRTRYLVGVQARAQSVIARLPDGLQENLILKVLKLS